MNRRNFLGIEQVPLEIQDELIETAEKNNALAVPKIKIGTNLYCGYSVVKIKDLYCPVKTNKDPTLAHPYGVAVPLYLLSEYEFPKFSFPYQIFDLSLYARQYGIKLIVSDQILDVTNEVKLSNEETKKWSQKWTPYINEPQKIYGESAGYICELGIGDSLFSVPAINVLRKRHKQLTVMVPEKVVSLYQELFPSLQIVGPDAKVKADIVYRSTGNIVGDIEGTKFPCKYPPKERYWDAHLAFQNLRNVGASIWDFDYSPERRQFPRPDFLKKPSALIFNGTNDPIRIWSVKEMHRTVEALKNAGFFVVNLYWSNCKNNVRIDNADYYLDSPRADVLAEVMSNAEVMVSNDSGPAHIRALFKKLCISIWIIRVWLYLTRPLSPATKILFGKCPQHVQACDHIGIAYCGRCKDMPCSNVTAEEIMEEINALYSVYVDT